MTTTTIDPSQLPATVRAYLAAHAAGETDAAVRRFAPDAEVVDDGHTYRGTDEILRFLTKAGATFRYTVELVGAQHVDDEHASGEHWVAVSRLEGDFPGGVVDLRYRFTLAGDLITALTIAP